MRRWVIAVAGFCAIAAPAKADWQFTKWGMTAEQVVAASNGTAQLGSGEMSAQGDVTKGAVGKFSTGEYRFEPSFWFNAAGLARVTMSLHDEMQCLGLQRDLLAKYGHPVEFEGGSVERRMWSDKVANNRVVLISTSGFCELQYGALVSKAVEGL